MGQKAFKGFDTRVDLCFTHYRKRLADTDGISVKAAIDGLVKAGVLLDDTSKEVRRVTHEQIKVSAKEPEKTVIEITEA